MSAGAQDAGAQVEAAQAEVIVLEEGVKVAAALVVGVGDRTTDV